MTFYCQRCGLTFNQKIILIKHLNKKTKCIAIENDINPSELIKLLHKKDGLECNLCNRIYKNNNSLRAHQCISQKNKNFNENLDTQSIYKDVKEVKEDITALKNQYQSLLGKYTSTLKRHHYVKFDDSSPCFYIIESGTKNYDKMQYKFGIAGTEETSSIDDRLKTHRTLWPLLKVRYLLFIKDVVMIEKSFKMMYDKEINPNGHEIIEGVSLDDMKKRIRKLFDILCITDFRLIPEENLKKYNEYVDMTVKTEDL